MLIFQFVYNKLPYYYGKLMEYLMVWYFPGSFLIWIVVLINTFTKLSALNSPWIVIFSGLNKYVWISWISFLFNLKWYTLTLIRILSQCSYIFLNVSILNESSRTECNSAPICEESSMVCNQGKESLKDALTCFFWKKVRFGK